MTEQSEQEKAMVRIQKAGPVLVGDNAAIAELLKSSPFCRLLCQILIESDEKLTLVGQGDLSDEKNLKQLIKTQGEAIGLSRAVEYIVNFALFEEEK